MSFGKCLADVFRGDVVSQPASAHVGEPVHFYTCLKDIWLAGTTASGASNTVWSDTVVDTFGPGYEGSRTIGVSTVRILPQERAPQIVGHQDNSEYAEFSEIYIYFKLGGPLLPSDIERVTNAELRVRRLIDYNVSVNKLGGTEVPITDPSIDPSGDVKVYWWGCASEKEKELLAQYYCYYVRLI